MRDTPAVFDAFSEAYDQWFDTPEGAILFGVEVDAVRRLVLESKRPTLEIGVGTGRFAQALGIEFGIDPSEQVLQIAKRREVSAVQARGESLPFASTCFCKVFLLFTICFVDDPRQVFSEAGRVLRKGGDLIVGMINRESSWGQLYLKKKAAGHPIYQHARFYSAIEVTKMLEKAGFVTKAYVSTLCRLPTQILQREPVYEELYANAGFVGILGRVP